MCRRFESFQARFLFLVGRDVTRKTPQEFLPPPKFARPAADTEPGKSPDPPFVPFRLQSVAPLPFEGGTQPFGVFLAGR